MPKTKQAKKPKLKPKQIKRRAGRLPKPGDNPEAEIDVEGWVDRVFPLPLFESLLAQRGFRDVVTRFEALGQGVRLNLRMQTQGMGETAVERQLAQSVGQLEGERWRLECCAVVVNGQTIVAQIVVAGIRAAVPSISGSCIFR